MFLYRQAIATGNVTLMPFELPTQALRWTCDLKSIPKCSDQVKPLESVIGQPRASEALSLGVRIREPGFNIYAAGGSGTGKTTSIRQFIDEIAKNMQTPQDCCYIHNFEDEYQPKVLFCPAGMGKQLKRDLQAFIDAARIAIPQLFLGEEYAAKREQIARKLTSRRQQIITKMEQVSTREGFTLQLTPVGVSLVPVVNGKPVPDEEFFSQPTETQKMITQKRDQLQHELVPLIRQLRELQINLVQEIGEFDRHVAQYAIEHLMADLSAKYKAYDQITTHLAAIQNHIMDNLDTFRGRTPDQKLTPQDSAIEELALRVYDVNVIVDNSELKGAPIITEQNPTFDNLLGRIEKESQFGTLTTDFTLIRGGSLQRANGGFIILRAEQLLRDLNVYEGLKRALKNKEILIEDIQQRAGYVSVRSLSPKPIPSDVKVVLIGQPDTYQLLFNYDPEFRELFKVKADFDHSMDKTEENVRNYARFFCGLAEREKLKHLDAAAIARMIEHGCRLVEDQDKLSTQFGLIADVVREAHFYASQDNAPLISAEHVEKAIEAKVYRSNLIQEKLQEYIRRNVILISTEGKTVGQVNGLSVLQVGDFAFGAPSRITVSVGLGGKEGLIDVQREVNMGGPIHGKGVMIIAGYLSGMFARDKPLSLSARIVFEQNYEGVEGDSASSTELYALLSAISEIPIKQNLAVTGSVNQKGEIQPIGGANEKIEGFFEVCKSKGLTGEQGVLIPYSNTKNLMLKREVIEAVEAHKFHIYAAKTIQEGIEILTGVAAGERKADGTFDENTIFSIVDHRLKEIADTIKKFHTQE